MEFRLELHIKPFAESISLRHQLMLVGSCFTDNIGQKLMDHKFRVLTNPAGILFNPFSIRHLLQHIAQTKTYQADDLFLHDELWTSWDFHGSFSGTDQDACLQRMNKAMSRGSEWLRQTDWLVITLGSAFRYDLRQDWPGAKAGDVVANCHKVPAQNFDHRLAGYEETVACMHDIIGIVRGVNPSCKIIFTISPVRHYREGLVENNRSKGILHNAVHAVLQQYAGVYYFPAYELVVDDLRDYRFYAEDLVHPNYAATQYVWEKFVQACISEEEQGLLKTIAEIRLAYRHRPSHPDTSLHRKFMDRYVQKTKALQAQHSFLDFSTELNYFRTGADLPK